ncbi:MAG: hypothetical protein KGN79_04105 [Acidobacteriota bacterium]|nr:hypothetical protein [Acidobacteriota bacterium]
MHSFPAMATLSINGLDAEKAAGTSRSSHPLDAPMAANDSVMEHSMLSGWQQLLALLGLNENAAETDMPAEGILRGTKSTVGGVAKNPMEPHAQQSGAGNLVKKTIARQLSVNLLTDAAQKKDGNAAPASPSISAALEARAKARALLTQNVPAMSGVSAQTCAMSSPDTPASSKNVDNKGLPPSAATDAKRSRLRNMQMDALAMAQAALAAVSAMQATQETATAHPSDADLPAKEGSTDSTTIHHLTAASASATAVLSGLPASSISRQMQTGIKEGIDTTNDAAGMQRNVAITEIEDATPPQTTVAPGNDLVRSTEHNPDEVAVNAQNTAIRQGEPISHAQADGVQAGDKTQSAVGAGVSQDQGAFPAVAGAAKTVRAKSASVPPGASSSIGSTRMPHQPDDTKPTNNSVSVHPETANVAHTDAAVHATSPSMIESRRGDGSAGTASSSSGQGAITGASTFHALDSGNGNVPGWVHAGHHQAEAGFEDPVLGWVGVRAHTDGAGVHAEVVPVSHDAALSLSTHLSGLQAYLAEHHRQIDTVQVAAPAAYMTFGSGTNGHTNAGAHGQQPRNSTQALDWTAGAPNGVLRVNAADAASGTSHAVSAATFARAQAGTYVSFMA